MYTYAKNAKCVECGQSKLPDNREKCPRCWQDFLAGIHRMQGRPFYLAPLGDVR